MPRVVVPIARLDAPTQLALAHARSIGPNDSPVLAIHVAADRASAVRLRRQWEASAPEAELVILEAAHDRCAAPLLAYLDALQSSAADGTGITVVSPDLNLAEALRGRPGVIVKSCLP